MSRKKVHHDDLLEIATKEFKIASPGIKSYTKRLNRGDLVKFARYGDGEWSCILSPDPKNGNCDGHPYSFELSSDLTETVLNPKEGIEYGMQPLAISQMGEMINSFVGNIEWSNADVFHAASEAGNLLAFTKALRKLRPILVAPIYYNKATFLHPGALVTVPQKNAYSAKSEIIGLLNQLLKPGDTVLFAASMLSEVLIYHFADLDVSLIDIGSLYDPYLQRNNRGYHEGLKLDERISDLG